MNEAESMLMEFQRNSMDQYSFFGLLFSAMFKADSGNAYKLSLGFPEHSEAVKRWKTEEGYAAKLTLAFNNGRGDIDGKRIE